MTQHVLVIGATSAIAEHTARRYAETGASLFLVGRREERLQAIAGDLAARGAARTATYPLDLNDTAAHQAMLDAAWTDLGQVDLVLIAHGTLPDQPVCERDPETTLAELATNGTSLIALMTRLANLLQTQGSGVLAVIGSVAGDRGRPSNYVYGSAKGAVALFAAGLRGRLARHGVHVLTIKPGFVATPMTMGLNLPAALVVPPERVARDIQRAVVRRRNQLYTPWFWRWIMLIIRAIPEPLFKRLSL